MNRQRCLVDIHVLCNAASVQCHGREKAKRKHSNNCSMYHNRTSSEHLSATSLNVYGQILYGHLTSMVHFRSIVS